MSIESQLLEKKSLKALDDWRGLAEDCVAFANARGGEIHIGIEDGEHLPPKEQKNLNSHMNKLSKQIRNNTNNVVLVSDIVTAKNGGEYIRLAVPRSDMVASTSSGKYRLRVGDENKPVVGDDVMRLAVDRTNWSWETLVTAQVPRTAADKNRVTHIVSKVKSSKNAKDAVKKKTKNQMLDHFKLAEGKYLTNLGILCVGTQSDRAKLSVAPIIQFIKKDEAGRKTNKIVWDEHDLSPMELVDDVWEKIPDFREIYEVPNGMRRDLIPAFEKEVVRELLVNALVHRPYTQKGDIFLNLNPDSLEVVNPGRLPIGVTPKNILHASVRRNDNLAKLFHDIGLMEREGTGIDRMYEILLSQGRPVPELMEGDDSFAVTLRRRLPDRKVISFISNVDDFLDLTPNERIVLGMLAKNGPVTARKIVERLGIRSVEYLKEWMERLLQQGIVVRTGNTRATQYSIAPDALPAVKSDEGSATLSLVSKDDYMTLVERDISQNPRSSIGEIHNRLENEITRRKLKRVLSSLVRGGRIVSEGVKRGTRYLPSAQNSAEPSQVGLELELPFDKPLGHSKG